MIAASLWGGAALAEVTNIRLRMLITLFGGLTACEKEGANFASLCTEVMSRDAPEGEVRIYNLDESLPDQACSCFAKTTVERNPDDLSE